MKKQLLILFIFTQSLTVFAQVTIQSTPLDLNQLPKALKYEGTVKAAIRFSDKTGDNIVIITETGSYTNAKFKHENEGNDAELFAYQFSIKNDSIKQLWKVYDYISDCPFDIEASFIKNTLQITDLNKDGMAEVWLLYLVACRSDVSPADMKIIMYQAQQKYAMRGKNKVEVTTDDKGNKQYTGGEYKFDPAFKSAPKEFSVFAEQLWKNNVMQLGAE
ncbi:MAG: hypothetical protein WBM13_14860 [Bacteroidia bacterium]